MDFIDEKDVIMVNGEPLLNGMFGVGKGTKNASGDEVLRLIMNLIPSNSFISSADYETTLLPLVTLVRHVILLPDEMMLLSSEDLSDVLHFSNATGLEQVVHFQHKGHWTNAGTQSQQAWLLVHYSTTDGVSACNGNCKLPSEDHSHPLDET